MSIRPALVFAFAALTLPLSLGACASAPRPVALAEPVPMYAPPPPPPHDPVEILAELPANAPPGECYAKVLVPGQHEAGPPRAAGARWVQSAGPPGSPGPIWCLVPAGPEPVVFQAERYGFIRVLCDTDITRDRVVGIQRRLHDGGYYAGAYTGQYDAPTAQAVTRFQSERHISHGGYLSVETVRAIEGSTVNVYVQPQISPQITVQQPAYQPPIYAQPIMAPPVYQQPIYPQPYPVYGGGYSSYTSYQGGYAAPVAASAAAAASAGRGGAAAAASASAGGGGYGYPGYGYSVQGGYGAPPAPAPMPAGYPPQAYGPGYNAAYYGTSGYAGYGQGFWSGPGQPGGAGTYPQLPYPLPYDNYGPGPAAWPAPGFGPQGYPRPAYAAPTSAVQSGWLNWSGKSYF